MRSFIEQKNEANLPISQPADDWQCACHFHNTKEALHCGSCNNPWTPDNIPFELPKMDRMTQNSIHLLLLAYCEAHVQCADVEKRIRQQLNLFRIKELKESKDHTLNLADQILHAAESEIVKASTDTTLTELTALLATVLDNIRDRLAKAYSLLHDIGIIIAVNNDRSNDSIVVYFVDAFKKGVAEQTGKTWEDLSGIDKFINENGNITTKDNKQFKIDYAQFKLNLDELKRRFVALRDQSQREYWHPLVFSLLNKYPLSSLFKITKLGIIVSEYNPVLDLSLLANAIEVFLTTNQDETLRESKEIIEFYITCYFNPHLNRFRFANPNIKESPPNELFSEKKAELTFILHCLRKLVQRETLDFVKTEKSLAVLQKGLTELESKNPDLVSKLNALKKIIRTDESFQRDVIQSIHTRIRLIQHEGYSTVQCSWEKFITTLDHFTDSIYLCEPKLVQTSDINKSSLSGLRGWRERWIICRSEGFDGQVVCFMMGGALKVTETLRIMIAPYNHENYQALYEKLAAQPGAVRYPLALSDNTNIGTIFAPSFEERASPTSFYRHNQSFQWPLISRLYALLRTEAGEIYRLNRELQTIRLDAPSEENLERIRQLEENLASSLRIKETLIHDIKNHSKHLPINEQELKDEDFFFRMDSIDSKFIDYIIKLIHKDFLAESIDRISTVRCINKISRDILGVESLDNSYLTKYSRRTIQPQKVNKKEKATSPEAAIMYVGVFALSGFIHPLPRPLCSIIAEYAAESLSAARRSAGPGPG